MAVVTVRPDGLGTGASNFTATGAASVHAALADNSDASFVQKNAITGTYSVSVTMGSTTLSGTQQVKQVRVRARALTPTTSGKVDVTIGTREDGVLLYHSALAIRGQYATATAFTGTYWPSTPSGSSWTQATIDGLRAQITEYGDGADRGTVYEVYADVDVANQPSVTVTAPTGTVNSTAFPAVAWTYTDPDSEAQTYYRVKVFTAAQYGAAGFAAETSTPEWDSGDVASPDTDTTITGRLLSGTYRTYVKAAKTINGAPFWSSWAFLGWTLSLTPPSTPTLTGAWNSTDGYATLTAQGSAPAGFASQFFEVQRSDDGGTTWAQIRDGEVPAATGNKAVVYDYEAPRGVTSRYRARAVGVNGSEEFATAWSNIVQVLVTNDGTWWFKVLDDPTLNVGGLRVDKTLSVTVTEPNAVFRPLGRSYPVVVSSVIGKRDGTFTIHVPDDDQWSSLETLLLYQGVILVQDPTPRQKFVRITSRSWDETYSAGVPRRVVKVDFVEVDG